MSYDETLAARVRRILSRGKHDVVERKMFGGLCFMVDGAMRCGVLKRDLVVKVGPKRQAEALAQPHTRVFDFTGRPSAGMVYVEPDGTQTDTQLRSWIRQGLAFVASKPPQPKRKSR